MKTHHFLSLLCLLLTLAIFPVHSVAAQSAVVVALPTAATGAPGTQVTIPIAVPTSVTGLGIIAYDFRLTFDSAVLSLVSVSSVGTLSAGWSVTPNTSTAGVLQVAAFNTAPLTGSGPLLNLVFNVVGARGTSTPLTWTSFLFNEGEPAVQTQNGLFAGVPLAITLPTAATAAVGSQVVIPVQVPDSATGLGIIAYDFRLDFNPAVLSFTGANSAGTLSAGWSVTPNTGTPGAARVVAFSATPMTGSGTLINLVFNVVGTANSATALTWNSFTFNNGVPVAQTSNGLFTVIAWRLGGNVTYRAITTRAMAAVPMTRSGASTAVATTNSSGSYSFTIQATGAHTVTPSLTGRVNGISAFDAAFIAQCVAGVRTSTDCPLLAADASGNNLLSAFDAAQVAQYAAGLAGPTSRVGKWLFSPANRTYATLTSDLLSENYTAYLVGEVSGNWQPPAATAAQQMTGEQRAAPLTVATATDGTVTLGHTGAEADLLAYQLTLHYDPSAGRLTEIIPAAAVSADTGWDLVVNESTPGVVELVGYGITPVNGMGALVTLRFQGAEGQVVDLSPTVVAVQLNEAVVWFNQEVRYQHFLPWIGVE